MVREATIIVADDHPLFRDALRQAIESLPVFRAVATAGCLEEAIDLVSRLANPELLLLDLKMPGSNGFSGLVRVRSERPDMPVVVVSASEDDLTIARALEAGAAGFIPKSVDANTIKSAIDAVLSGEIWYPADRNLENMPGAEFTDLVHRLQSLTPQQNRVLEMLGEGLLNKQIAYELGVSEATVKAHVSAVLTKLGVDSRTQAVIAMAKLTLPDQPYPAGSLAPS
jgi:DNA-binding NarL/FixJ family response regulator